MTLRIAIATGRRIGAGAAAGLVLALVALVLPAAAQGATADPLTSWVTPTGWTQVAQLPSTPAQQGECRDGAVHRYSDGSSDSIVLEVVRCANAAQANRWQNSVWAGLPRSTASVTSALGDGYELDTATVGVVRRQWDQGQWGLQLTATCSAGATGRCAEVSRSWVRSIASQAPAPAPIGPLRSVMTGPQQHWQPDSGGYWRLARSQPYRSYCADWSDSLWLGAKKEQLQVAGGDCGSTEAAVAAARDFWLESRSTAKHGLSDLMAGPYRWAAWTATDGNQYVARTWAQGERATVVQLSCPQVGRSTCDSYLLGYAQQLTAALAPARVVEDHGTQDILWSWAWLGFLLPTLSFAALVVPTRLWSRRNERRWDAHPGPRFRPTDRIARRARFARNGRWWLIAVVSIALCALLDQWAIATGQVWSVAVVLFDPFLVGGSLAGLLGLVWKPPLLVRPPRFRSGWSGKRAAGLLCRTTAYVVLVLALAFYAVSYILVLRYAQMPEYMIQLQVHNGLATGTVDGWIAASLEGFLDWARRSNTVVLFFVTTLLVPGTAALLLDRLGRRLQRLGLHETLRRDPRPYFLYLRGFDEDSLRVQEVAGRFGLIEMLAPFIRPRFEEVLAERLAHFGPVIAIASHRARVADLGAAKASFADDQWRDRVEDFAEHARAIVMSATPRQVTDGLGWEIRHIAGRHPDLTLLLVLSPWPRLELQRRWQGFLAYAQSHPPFDDLGALEPPDGVQVLTWHASTGWRAYGAARRWDWTYAASITEAVRELDREDAAVAAAPSAAVAVARVGEAHE